MQRRLHTSPTATALLKPLHDAAARPSGRSPDSSTQRALVEQRTLSDRTFPHLTMQWHYAIRYSDLPLRGQRRL